MHLEVLHGVAEEGPEELGKGATTHHPTRRPQHIEYAVVEEGGDAETWTERETVTGSDDVHTDVEREEEESEEVENEEEHKEVEEDTESEEIKVEESREEREGFEVSELAEDGDGRTVLVESENFVFRVRPEEIEFEL